MALSTLTGVPEIAENSQATPGLWNNISSIISRNVSQINADASDLSTAVGWGRGSITTTLNTSAGTFSALTIRAVSGNTVSFSTWALSTSSVSAPVVLAIDLSVQTLRPQSGNTIRVLNTANLIARSYDSGGAFYDVRAFGAVGDGTTNDFTAIDNTISTASANGGGTIYFSKGTYLINSGLQLLGSNLAMRGEGPGISVIQLGNALNVAVVVSARGGGASAVSNIHLRDLTFDGNRAQNTGSYTVCQLQYVDGGSIINCEATAGNNIGFGFGNGAVAGPTTRDIYVANCSASSNSGNGFDCNNAQRIFFANNVADTNGNSANGGVGFFVGAEASTSTVVDVLYLGNHSTGNAGGGFQATASSNGSCRRITYIGNHSISNQSFGYLVNQGSGGVATGPFVFLANTASQNSGAINDSITTGGTVSNLIALANMFGTMNRIDTGIGTEVSIGRDSGISLGNNLGRLSFRQATGGAAMADVVWAGGDDRLKLAAMISGGGFDFLDSTAATNLFQIYDTGRAEVTSGFTATFSSVSSTGQSISPVFHFNSERSLGWYRSGVSTIALSYGTLSLQSVKFNLSNTGAGSALLGTNSPAGTLTAPFEWARVITSDGAVGFIPVWK